MATTTTDAAGSDPIEIWLSNGAGTEKVRITAAGNVGIGTTSPSYPLHIYGSDPRIFIQDSATGFAMVFIENSDNSCWLGIDNSSGSLSGQANGVYVSSNGEYPLTLMTNETARLTILAGGDVGIGVTTPASTLHVKNNGGTTFGSADQLRLDGGGSGNYAQLHLTDGVTSDGYLGFKPSSTATSRYLVLDAGSGHFDALVVLGNDNVGIGTTSPQSLLDVNGGVAIGSYAGTDAAPSNGLIISGAVGVGTDSPASKFDVNGGVSIGSYAGADAAPTNGLIISGNVGIGTDSPTNALSVAGFANFKTPAAQVSLSSTPQSIPNATPTLIAWTSALFDNDSFFSGTYPTRLTAPVAGIYMIGCNIYWDGVGGPSYGDYRQINIIKSGGSNQAIVQQLATGGISGMVASTIFSLAANEYVEIEVTQNYGFPVNLLTGSFFWIYKISD